MDRPVDIGRDAIQRAGREAIRAAAFATRDHDGVLGKWLFDQNGDATLTAAILHLCAL